MKSRFLQPTLHITLVAIVAGCGSASPQRERPDKNVVTAADLERHSHEPIEYTLQRKFPGIVVGRTSDGELTIQIRGTPNYRGEPTPPLYVLNDMPFEPGAQGAISHVNPYDIESIKVLRGAEAAIYGVQGANGVIIIKTKQAVKPK